MRKDDGKGWAWGLQGKTPSHIWERFSPAYEAQAQTLLEAMRAEFGNARLDWAGSQDGEAAISVDAEDEIVFLWHLEDPRQAETLAKVIARGGLTELLRSRRD